MKHTFTYSHRILMIVLLAGACCILPVNLHAAQLFSSPDEAVKALQAAIGSKDKTALREIFGSDVQELLTGDKVQDANNAQKFAAVLAQGYTLVKETDDRTTIDVGTNSWPMPIPLVRSNGYWHFDTAAGKEEIINRHIGKDELYAIGVCRAYVTAQQQYASTNPEASQGVKYAQRFKSKPGKKDGLYWPSAENEMASPFGSLVAEAYAEGYIRKSFHPFHGYYFKILTRQGNAAPGGRMNYISHGNLTGGFALVAYPEYWGRSGIMTFIVNQSHQVFQRDLGEKTFRIAGEMKEYDPDSGWTLVQDEGILNVVSEK